MSQEQFDKMATEYLTQIQATGGDAAAIEKRYRDALNKVAENRMKQAMGIEVTGILSAEKKLAEATKKLLGVVSLNADERKKHQEKENALNASILSAEKELRKVIRARTAAIMQATEASTSLLTRRSTAAALGGTASGRAAGALGTATDIGKQRAGILAAQSDMNFAKIAMAEAAKTGDKDAFTKAKEVFDETSQNFKDKVREAATSLQVNIDKAEKSLTKVQNQIQESFKAERAARVAAAATTLGQEINPQMLKKELDAIAKAMKGGDLKELEKRLTDFSTQGLGTPEQLFTAQFGQKLGKELGDAFMAIQAGKLEGGGLAPNFMENLNKAKGFDKSQERKELRAEQANLRKTINLLNDEFDRMTKETSTATITNEVKRLKEGIDNAGESFIGVDNYVRA